jgi:nucleotide-binding universal stress UspA family protein
MTVSKTASSNTTPTVLIVGVDYDATCHIAASHAFALARMFSVPVQLIHACSSPYVGDALSSQTQVPDSGANNVLDALRSQERDDMCRFVASLNADDSVIWRIESGDPKRVLLEHVSKLPGSWLVLGARKHAAVAEWFLGSTAAYVVRHCQRPVLVVPPRAATQST